MPMDPADPLALLLHADALVAPPDGEPDWVALSAALWAAEHADQAKAAPFPALDGDFDFDYDLGGMAVDPSVDPFFAQEPYGFDTLGGLDTDMLTGRRMSVGSSSSSSGASLSPVLNPATAAPSPAAPMNTDSFAALIKTLSSNPALLSGDFSSLAPLG